MTILIVDDSIDKINKIKVVIEETSIAFEFLIAQNKADAMKLILSNKSIDLMLLDLNLPNRKGESAKRLAGLSLLKELNRRATINKPKHIIGLTAYDNLQKETVNEFIEKGWIIITYDTKKSEWEETIKNKVEYINCCTNPKNINVQDNNDFALIMKGGGIKGLAYVGALEELSKFYNFNWYVGTSAGAISAILLGSGYTTNELNNILNKKDFNDFKDAKLLKKIINLFFKKGLYEAESFTNWLDNLIAVKLNSPTAITLNQLPNRVTVYASRKEKGALIFDSNDPSKNTNRVGYVARCSMSIPFIFTPQKNEGLNVFDGGTQNNYPVEILLKHNPNSKFIGLYLGPEHYEGETKKSILGDLLSIWTESSDIEALEKYRDETVIIDVRPISTLKFKLNKDEKSFLLDSGRLSALKFLISKGKVSSETINIEDLKNKLDITRQVLFDKIRKRRKRRKITFIISFILLGIGYIIKLYFL